MEVSYFHVSDDLPEGNFPNHAVVTDVLRATTTIAFALNNGAESVQVFSDLDILRSQSSKWNDTDKILIGERGGVTIPDFDLGNSPLGVSTQVVKGKRLFMSTTNGTRALSAVSSVDNLYTMALVNRSAVAKKLINSKPNSLWIIGSGWEGSYSLEDSLAAGALVSYLLDSKSLDIAISNDEVHSALALWSQWSNNIERCLRTSSHGARLSKLGDHNQDFRCCSMLDHLSIVPTQTEKGVLCAS